MKIFPIIWASFLWLGVSAAQLFANPQVVVQDIYLLGLHKTRPWVVQRECLFRKGDTLQVNDIPIISERTRQNIYNLGLFTRVNVQALPSENGLHIIIDVKERWFLLGNPFLKLEERNAYDVVEALRRGDFHRMSAGGVVDWRNLTGRNESLKAHFLVGFSKRLSLSYLQPAISQKKNIDLFTAIHYTYEPEIILGTEGGRAQWRSVETHALKQRLGAYAEIRRRFSTNHWLNFGLGYDHFRLSDSLFTYQIGGEPVRFTPSSQLIEAYPNATINWIRDFRDIRPYPLKGYKLHLFARYAGWGGKFSSHFGKIGFTWAHHLPIHRRWYFAYGMQEILTLGQEVPFFEKSFLGLSHRDFPHINHQLRGYEPYAIGSTWQTMIKSELKFAVIPYQIVHLGFIPFKGIQDIPLSLYLTTFAETAYLQDRSLTRQDDTFLNRPLFGYGFGLNVTGFYDMLGRVEYSWNHLGQGGLYLHTILPIK